MNVARGWRWWVWLIQMCVGYETTLVRWGTEIRIRRTWFGFKVWPDRRWNYWK